MHCNDHSALILATTGYVLVSESLALCSHFEICTLAVTLLVGMGRRTEWQASWGEVVDSNGDKYGEYLVKLDEEDVKCR